MFEHDASYIGKSALGILKACQIKKSNNLFKYRVTFFQMHILYGYFRQWLILCLLLMLCHCQLESVYKFSGNLCLCLQNTSVIEVYVVREMQLFSLLRIIPNGSICYNCFEGHFRENMFCDIYCSNKKFQSDAQILYQLDWFKD